MAHFERCIVKALKHCSGIRVPSNANRLRPALTMRLISTSIRDKPKRSARSTQVIWRLYAPTG
jgi:hypothetical protein